MFLLYSSADQEYVYKDTDIPQVDIQQINITLAKFYKTLHFDNDYTIVMDI